MAPSPLLAATLNGVVVDPVHGLYVQGAQVEVFDREEHRVISNFIGLFEIEDLAPGAYELTVTHPAYETKTLGVEVQEGEAKRRIELEPKWTLEEIEASFELSVHVAGIVSNWQLPGAEIRIERRLSAGSAAPSESWTVVSDAHGNASIAAVRPGFFRITAQKAGWEALALSDTELVERQLVAMYLEPKKCNLGVKVTEGLWKAPLHGVAVEVTGVVPQTHKPLISPRWDLTDGRGEVRFNYVPPIAWRIRASKLGYESAETIVETGISSNSCGAWAELELELAGTALEVEVTSAVINMPWSLTLEGVAGTSAQWVTDIARPYIEVPAPEESPTILFENLLLGVYEVRAQGHTSARDNSGPHSIAAVSIRATGMAVVEVANGEVQKVVVDLELEPANVRGRLLAMERWAPKFAGNYRVDGPQEPLGRPVTLNFVAAAMDHIYPEEMRTFSVTTDEQGFFAAKIPPGTWSVTIPELPDYSGHTVFVDQHGWDARQWGWPLVTPWPHGNTYIQNVHGAPMRLESGRQYDVDLIVHPHRVGLRVPLHSSSGFGTQIVLAGNGLLGIFEPPIRAFPPQARVDGVPVETHIHYAASATTMYVEVEGVGVHTITLDHPFLECDSLEVDLTTFTPPGIPPAQAPPFFVPGWSQPTSPITCNWPVRGDEVGTQDIFFWCELCGEDSQGDYPLQVGPLPPTCRRGLDRGSTQLLGRFSFQ